MNFVICRNISIRKKIVDKLTKVNENYAMSETERLKLCEQYCDKSVGYNTRKK